MCVVAEGGDVTRALKSHSVRTAAKRVFKGAETSRTHTHTHAHTHTHGKSVHSHATASFVEPSQWLPSSAQGEHKKQTPPLTHTHRLIFTTHTNTLSSPLSILSPPLLFHPFSSSPFYITSSPLLSSSLLFSSLLFSSLFSLVLSSPPLLSSPPSLSLSPSSLLPSLKHSSSSLS